MHKGGRALRPPKGCREPGSSSLWREPFCAAMRLNAWWVTEIIRWSRAGPRPALGGSSLRTLWAYPLSVGTAFFLHALGQATLLIHQGDAPRLQPLRAVDWVRLAFTSFNPLLTLPTSPFIGPFTISRYACCEVDVGPPDVPNENIPVGGKNPYNCRDVCLPGRGVGRTWDGIIYCACGWQDLGATSASWVREPTAAVGVG